MRHAYRSFHHSRGEFGREERRGIGAAAAVAVSVAAVAAAGVQAASAAGAFGGGAEGGGAAGGGYVAPGLRERMFNRGTQSILDSERQILDDSIAQGKLIEPELYRALGLEPIYDRPEDPELAGRTAALGQSQQRLNDIRLRRSALKGQKGPGLKARQRELRQLDREANRLNRDIATMTEDVEQRTAVGRRVVGFRNIPGVADPTGSAGGRFGGVLDDFNAHLDAALSGREPLDPTLQREYMEREQTLRERLRRQLGPDYDTTTAGADALANFDREKTEAFAQYNRQSIEGFSALAEGRAGALSDLTGQRLKQLSFPAALRGDLGAQLEGAVGARNEFVQGPASERRAQEGAAERRQARRDAAAQERADMINSLAGAGAGAVGAGAGTLGTYFAEQNVARGAADIDAAYGTPASGYSGVAGALLQ